MDISRLPLEVDTEELVITLVETGEARLINHADKIETRLNWDADVFPQCLLWLSNRGRSAFPWNTRFCAVGIEPIAAAFDLGEIALCEPTLSVCPIRY
ncbi:MAG: hypothetical protein ACC631_00560 [Halocynthiibacter sp.]